MISRSALVGCRGRIVIASVCLGFLLVSRSVSSTERARGLQVTVNVSKEGLK